MHQQLPVISAMYFGPVEFYRWLATQKEVILDVGEHYERQSYRNRTTIPGPNGVQHLVVQIARRSGEKMPMHTVGLSYIESWPQQHMHAMRSAYGKAPWSIHFTADIEELITTHHERLIDLDLASMRLCMKWLGITTTLHISGTYVENDGAILDLRSQLHPKKPLPEALGVAPVYPQVFSDRHGFVGRMSIMDLLCNCGPQAKRYLLGG